jgi:hypothetical protein
MGKGFFAGPVTWPCREDEMNEILSNVFLYILTWILSFIESLYNSLKNEKFWVIISIVVIIFIALSILDKLTKLDKTFNILLEQFSKRYSFEEINNNDDTIYSVLTEMRDKLQGKGHVEEFPEEIKSYNISDAQRLSLEEFRKIKIDIFDLLNEPNDSYNVAGLPTEIGAAKRAYRFILLIDKYNYLTKNNLPGIEGTADGGVSLTFGFMGMSWFVIEIPPEDNQAICFYQDLFDDTSDNVKDYLTHRFNLGYSNNPLQVLHELIESGELIDS